MQMLMIESDRLASLLILDKSMEPTPEPFRMHNNLKLIIPFREYLSFVDDFLEKEDYLLTPTKILKAKRYDEKAMFSFFLLDVAGAVCKELHYAEKKDMDATIIRHSCEESYSYGLDFIKELAATIDDSTIQELRNIMSYRDFELPKRFRVDNNILWQYAIVCYALSKQQGGEWEVPDL